MKNKKKTWLVICLFLFTLCGAIIFIRLFSPTCWALLGNIFFPDKTYSITIFIDEEKFESKLFYKKQGHLNNQNQLAATLLLCNIPLGTKKKEHIKIFPNGLGVFQNSEQNFVVFPRYLFIQEGALLTMPLEDDMKGWNTAYSISRKNGMYHYKIFPQLPHYPFEIKFSIDENILKTIPDFENAGLYKLQEKHSQINYTYGQWKIFKFQNHLK